MQVRTWQLERVAGNKVKIEEQIKGKEQKVLYEFAKKWRHLKMFFTRLRFNFCIGKQRIPLKKS